MKNIIIGFVIFVCVAIGICFESVQYTNTRDFRTAAFVWGMGGAKLSEVYEFDVDEIHEINIAYSSENLVFYKSETNQIVIKEYFYGNRKSTQLEIIGETLHIRNEVPTIVFFGWISERVEVYLPESYVGDLKATTKSGNIKIEEIGEIKELKVSASSGNITCKEVKADSIHASASSGNITFGKAQGKRHFTASSGNIKVMAGEGDTYADAKSGNITIEDISGELSAFASSGNIKADFIQIGNIDVKTSSGNIKLGIPKDSEFSYEASANSGIIRTDFDEFLSYNKKKNQANGMCGENAEFVIRTKASSGNTRVTIN